MAMNNILIQGNRGAGKTHLVHRIIERYNSRRLAGFFTFKDAEGIVYFRAWDNDKAIEQSPPQIIFRKDEQIVRYGVFEKNGVRAIEHAISYARLMIFDELGRFEQDCELFTNAVRSALVCNTPVLASLKSESNPFLDSLRRRKDCSVHTLTKNNMEEIFASVAQALDSLLYSA